MINYSSKATKLISLYSLASAASAAHLRINLLSLLLQIKVSKCKLDFILAIEIDSYLDSNVNCNKNEILILSIKIVFRMNVFLSINFWSGTRGVVL